jgi:4'-phosphopantetheinyl transferase
MDVSLEVPTARFRRYRSFTTSWLVKPRGAARLEESFFMQQGQVDLWYVHLLAAPVRIADLYETLSHDEKRRANRFYFEKDRDSFIIGRGILRAVLGAYLGQSPRTIHFQYGPNGKPGLQPRSRPVLYFNLTHSEEFAVYAFSRDCELGVDLECLREIGNAEDIASRFFSPDECADLLSLNPDQRKEAFFNCWTRKEAYLKAVGDGLSVPRPSLLDGVEVRRVGRRYSTWAPRAYAARTAPALANDGCG